MFTQLMPLIQNRPLTITVAAVSATQIRVNVVPQPTENDKKANDQVGYSHNKEVAKIPDSAIQAFTTPLSLTGTPEEIDAELAQTLTKFTVLHVGLQQAFDAAAAVIRDSVKAIDERERLKKEKDKANSKKPSAPKPDEKKPTEDAALPSLFTTQGQDRPAAVSANDAETKSALKNEESVSVDQIEEGED
jgi:PRTRC genetic system protein E